MVKREWFGLMGFLFLLCAPLTFASVFAPPYDLSGQQVLFVEPKEVQATIGAPITITVRLQQPSGYIWKTGYYQTKQEEWKPFFFSGKTVEGTNWMLHTAQARAGIPSQDWDYGEQSVVAYSCKRWGAQWDCGAISSGDLSTLRWRRHTFSVLPPTAPSTVQPTPKAPPSNRDLTLSTEATRRIKEEADWIVSCCKRPSGALLLAQGSTINPYFANFAAQALLLAGTEYHGHVKEYLQWYITHLNKPDRLNIHGTIYDYKVVNGVEQATNSYDSSDSYAATFLSLVKEYHDVSGDRTFVQAHLAELKSIAKAIDATLQPNGLTFAKKDYKIAFLMDNVEVWKGYQDFADLLKQMDDPGAGTYAAKAMQVRNAIERLLWDTRQQAYKPHFGGTMDWKKFYPDATANMWPLVYGLPEAEGRRLALWQKFITHHPDWKTNTADAFPWTALNLAALAAGDKEIARVFDTNTRAKFHPGRQWTWNINEAAWYIRYTAQLES